MGRYCTIEELQGEDKDINSDFFSTRYIPSVFLIKMNIVIILFAQHCLLHAELYCVAAKQWISCNK